MQSATTLEVYILVITQRVVNTLTMVNGSLSMMPGRLSYLLKNQSIWVVQKKEQNHRQINYKMDSLQKKHHVFYSTFQLVKALINKISHFVSFFFLWNRPKKVNFFDILYQFYMNIFNKTSLFLGHHQHQHDMQYRQKHI